MSFLFYLDVCCHATWSDATSHATWSVWGSPYTYICVTCQAYYYWDLSGWFTSIASVHTLTKASYSNTQDSYEQNHLVAMVDVLDLACDLNFQSFLLRYLEVFYFTSAFSFLIIASLSPKYSSFFYFFIITIHSMQCLRGSQTPNGGQQWSRDTPSTLIALGN